MLTVSLEDHGQDFLHWDIENGVVVGCRPFQEWLWKGTKVHNNNIQPGDILEITPPNGKRVPLNYPVKSVREKAPQGGDSNENRQGNRN